MSERFVVKFVGLDFGMRIVKMEQGEVALFKMFSFVEMTLSHVC